MMKNLKKLGNTSGWLCAHFILTISLTNIACIAHPVNSDIQKGNNHHKQLIDIDSLINDLDNDMNFIIQMLSDYLEETKIEIPKLFHFYEHKNIKGMSKIICVLRENSLVLRIKEMTNLFTALELSLSLKNENHICNNLNNIVSSFERVELFIEQVSKEFKDQRDLPLNNR